MSSFNNSTIDNLLLQGFMDRLNLRSSSMDNNPLVSQSLEDFLLDDDFDDDNDDDEIDYEARYGAKAELIREESKLEKEVIKTILSGRGDTLKPNSGQAVSVRNTNICVGNQNDDNNEYRVWEWHGHIMVYDEEHGYSPEYIYGNYFQRLVPRRVAPAAAAVADEDDDDDEEAPKKEENGNLGLKDLIDNDSNNKESSSAGGRILHRHINAGSSGF
ncbi:uncharacterized protein LOC130730432 [Lotus japonicus]|uniref:uncharacterized protein LOC130730432 n=1 Tax=Lotus japonicus TaxID=34305 RepID=UPI002585CF75|nr:uncharacterized protein LOC130730432 [Lotus japonicus]